MKILIIDDEENLLKLYKKVFSSGLPNCNIDVADNAKAMDAFQKGHHEVLLLDLNMPGKDGYAIFLEVQKFCSKEKIKMPFVVFCTGYGIPPELEEKATDSSRYCLLRKPVTIEKLLEVFRYLQQGHIR